jgi:ABC-type phosphate transport system substrate-binding protein
MCKAGLKEQVAKDTKAFIDYGLGEGQAIAEKLNYAPLPSNILKQAQAKSDALLCNGAPLS